MPNLVRLTKKPEYFFQPSKFLERCLYKFKIKPEKNSVDLLWGHMSFHINPRETVGKSILHFGLYDLVVTEAIFRLRDKNKISLDVGANIGYFTSLLSHTSKEVHSFEPHPKIFESLNHNCGDLSNAHLNPFGLSNQTGEFQLYIPQDFDQNEGIASLEPMENAIKITVQTKTIDQLFPTESISTMKIDVENHEEAVLKGAKKALAEKRIHHIIFEDFNGADSPCIQLLRKHGYEVFRLAKGYFDLELKNPEDGTNIPLWEPPNYLATIDPYPIRSINGWTIFQNL